ncbi:siderophore iron transporter [Metarhizium album ARSEF 1941]|uniref:Siderophore iron transporter n=1 Tax=Metarhizium album (strain ARSEF 1941) TaxID=1081103 RepID=A0A0B2WX64_METAS|nr:siderophore iron transporter [Metarhizium album ARSEF 1941]KHN98643.1 siderophore iron transporter [Metarhizium album ARSEF 1941]
MSFLPKIFARAGDESPVPGAAVSVSPHGKTAAGSSDAAAVAGADSSRHDSAVDAQAGVLDMEAVSRVWSRGHIVLTYVFIWLIYLVDSMHSSMSFTLAAYVTSSFQQHGLTATTNVFANLIGGLFRLPLAKILDIWGRPQGFALVVLFLVIGLVMMAACQNVETYAAAQVFYWIGFNGIAYTLQVFIADTSELKNRAFFFALTTSPFLITTWASGPAASSFLAGAGWRWAFGTFAIVVPVVCAPVLALFSYNHFKAGRSGALPPRRPSGRTALEGAKHYLVQFDVVGLLLAAAGMALFLLPFNIYQFQAEQWRSPLIIAMVAAGVLLLVVFALYERYVAPVQFIPYKVLVDRTVMGACVLGALGFVSFYLWNGFFSSFLQVVVGLTVTEATYVGRTYNMGSCFWALVVGVVIRWSGRLKWLAFYFGVPLMILGIALMTEFRRPGVDAGYVVMCQVFIAVAGGTLVICEQMAVMAAVSHQNVAVALAMLSMFTSIGGAIGSSVSGAIWNGVFPAKLAEYLPPETKDEAALIVGNLSRQLEHPWGSPSREAIMAAYGDAQRVMLISATAFACVSIVAVAVWRDVKVR